MFRLPLVVVMLSASVCAGSTERDLNAEITRLGSPSASERGAAQRWLAAHLECKDGALVAERLRDADAETRGRWIEILGAEDRLALVGATLAAGEDEQLARVGRAALESAIHRWNPASRTEVKLGVERAGDMDAWAQPRLELDLVLASAPLEDVLDLVARVAPGHVGIAVDPRVDAGARAATHEAFAGTFAALLRELSARHELLLVGIACDEEKSDPARWFALLPKSKGKTSGVSALTLLRDWSVELVRGDTGAQRSAAARAIAASGWPTGVALLAAAWREKGDEAALDGLMLAARRDRVAPELCAEAAQAALRARIARALSDVADDGRNAINGALALGATGMRGADGRDLCAPALEGLDELAGRPLLARLVELEDRGPNDDAARAAIDRVLGREDVPAGIRFLALEMRARWSAPLDALPRAEELVEFAARQGRLSDMLRWLRDARSFPPAAWRDAASLPASWTPALRAFVAAAWLARGDAESAVASLTVVLRGADAKQREELALELRGFVSDADPSARDALFAALVSSPDGVRFVALAGGVRTEASADEVLAGIAQPATSREDLLLLGALAASPRGAKARTRLIEALAGSADLADMWAARERALAEIRALRDFDLEREFGNAVLAASLHPKFWEGRPPPEPLGEAIHLGALDRSCTRFGL